MKYLFLFYLVFHFVSCNSSLESLFEIGPKMMAGGKITISDIADDIFYFPLDNLVPIGTTYKIKLTGKHIYLSVKDAGILKFDRSGKLVCKIGNHGRGPGEYYYGMNYTIDEKSGNVYVMDRNVIKVYSGNGLFIRDIYYGAYLSQMGADIEILDSRLFIPDYNQNGNSKFDWIVLDTLGNLIYKKENSIPPYMINMVIPGQTYKFENKIFYFNNINDTIFSISSGLRSTGAYLFSNGDHRYPKSNFIFKSINQLYNIFKPTKMFETEKYIFLSYSYLERSAISLINKKTNKVSLAYEDGETKGMVKTRALIKNDLDGGLSFSTSQVVDYYKGDDSEYIVTLINPFDLKKYLSGKSINDIVAKYPEKKKKLEKLASSLKETDNPVLMLVRLKK